MRLSLSVSMKVPSRFFVGNDDMYKTGKNYYQNNETPLELQWQQIHLNTRWQFGIVVARWSQSMR